MCVHRSLTPLPFSPLQAERKLQDNMWLDRVMRLVEDRLKRCAPAACKAAADAQVARVALQLPSPAEAAEQSARLAFATDCRAREAAAAAMLSAAAGGAAPAAAAFAAMSGVAAVAPGLVSPSAAAAVNRAGATTTI